MSGLLVSSLTGQSPDGISRWRLRRPVLFAAGCGCGGSAARLKQRLSRAVSPLRGSRPAGSGARKGSVEPGQQASEPRGGARALDADALARA